MGKLYDVKWDFCRLAMFKLSLDKYSFYLDEIYRLTHVEMIYYNNNEISTWQTQRI